MIRVAIILKLLAIVQLIEVGKLLVGIDGDNRKACRYMKHKLHFMGLGTYFGSVPTLAKDMLFLLIR